MKNLLLYLSIIFFSALLITSCTKMDSYPDALSQNQLKKVNPNVLECGTGYHWDYTLKKCVADCPSGYHNDPTTGACVIDGGGGGGSQQNITVVTNPNNPVEIVGSDHNSGMTNIIPNYDYGQLLPTEENVLAYVKTWQYSAGFDTTNFMDGINWVEAHFGEPVVMPQHDFDNGITEAYSQAFISLTEKNYLTDLSNEIKSFTADSLNTPTQSQYNT